MKSSYLKIKKKPFEKLAVSFIFNRLTIDKWILKPLVKHTFAFVYMQELGRSEFYSERVETKEITVKLLLW